MTVRELQNVLALYNVDDDVYVAHEQPVATLHRHEPQIQLLNIYSVNDTHDGPVIETTPFAVHKEKKWLNH